MKNKKNWYCEVCYITFKTKKALIEDLKRHFEDATDDADTASGQLYSLRVKDYYE